MIVLDCSYTMAMVMPDEQRPSSLPAVERGNLMAPCIWPFEVANAFCNAVRRKRFSAEHAAKFALRIDQYGVQLDNGDAQIYQRFLAAQTHDLTAYDASYLSLALQRRCGLASLDQRLLALAKGLGITVYD